jgi:preprotein translocase subunit SecY
LVWGFVALLCIGTVLYVWFGHSNAIDHAAFGRPVSLAVLAVALVATLVGAVASFVPRDTSSGLRWGVAFPVAAVAASVIVLAAGSLFAQQHAIDFVMGVLLLAGAISMAVVAVQVGRRRLPRPASAGAW